MYTPLQQTIKYLPLSLPLNQISCPLPSQSLSVSNQNPISKVK